MKLYRNFEFEAHSRSISASDRYNTLELPDETMVAGYIFFRENMIASPNMSPLKRRLMTMALPEG